MISYYCILYFLQLVIPFRDYWFLHGEHFSSFGLQVNPAESHIDGRVFFAISAMHILNSSKDIVKVPVITQVHECYTVYQIPVKIMHSGSQRAK